MQFKLKQKFIFILNWLQPYAGSNDGFIRSMNKNCQLKKNIILTKFGEREKAFNDILKQKS